jgi:hypothetical protein
MTKFKIKVVSGGIVRQTFLLEAKDLQAVARELNARVVNSCPGWAFAQYGPLSSVEITW